MTRPARRALDVCIYFKRCEVQYSVYEDLRQEIDLYNPEYYRYWARAKVQICSKIRPL